MKPASQPVAADRALINRIAAGGYDAAVIFTVYSQNPLAAAYLVYLAGVPTCLAHCRENAYHLLSDRVPDPEPQQRVRHEVRRQLDLVATTGAVPKSEALTLSIPTVARRRAAAALATLRIPRDGPLVVAHAGATAPSRRYPPQRFAEALDMIALEQRAQVVLTGDASEIALNTAPVHVAAAVGTPVVDLYALTNPQHVPWRVAHRLLYHDVPCRYCYKSVCPTGHHDCLARVQPAEVADAVRALLDSTFEPVRATLDALPAAAHERRPSAPHASV
jgi:ADP-heptose:LPS heptosyltransferase